MATKPYVKAEILSNFPDFGAEAQQILDLIIDNDTADASQDFPAAFAVVTNIQEQASEAKRALADISAENERLTQLNASYLQTMQQQQSQIYNQKQVENGLRQSEAEQAKEKVVTIGDQVSAFDAALDNL